MGQNKIGQENTDNCESDSRGENKGTGHNKLELMSIIQFT